MVIDLQIRTKVPLLQCEPVNRWRRPSPLEAVKADAEERNQMDEARREVLVA